jgi:glycerophosphoryl diester phosphodiesterase
MLKIGHRGAKGNIAENNLESFQKAIDLGCDGIELDIHSSSDGKAMVIHDETLDRTTTSNGFVNDFYSAELQNLGIPTLEEVLDLIDKKCFVNIEIKDAKATNQVLKIIQKYTSEKNWNYDLFQVSSFDWEVLELVSNQNPKINIGVLTEDNLEKAMQFAQKINAFSINPYYKLLDSEKVSLLQQNGFQVFAWTINEFSDIEKMKSFSVDGIISDFPDRI